MATQIIRGAEVNRPIPDPLTSTVLDHATVHDLSSFGLRNNDGLFPSYNVLDTAVPTELCPDVPGTKEFSFADWIEGHEFAVYGGVQCKAVGLDKEDMFAELRRVFSANEGKGVEQGLLETFVGGTTVDLTPGSGFTLGQALASLIGYAAQNYAGQPTIHMPRAAASILFGVGVLVERDGVFYTKTGAKVAAGGGYDSANYVGGADATWDMYATGEVYVERSEQIDANSYVLPGDGSGIGSDENGLSDNTVLALAERMYRVAVDGLSSGIVAAKATGTAWS